MAPRKLTPMQLICDGAFGCGCPEKREKARARYQNLEGHGTRTKYNQGCRCITCTRANARYMRQYRGKEGDGLKHGVRWTYQHYHCRCEACKDANNEYARQQYQKRKNNGHQDA